MKDHDTAVAVEHAERSGRQRDPAGPRLHRAHAELVHDEVGDVAHMEWMIDVGIGIAGRARIEMASRRGVGGSTSTLGILMDVQAMLAGFELTGRTGDGCLDVDSRLREVSGKLHEGDFTLDA